MTQTTPIQNRTCLINYAISKFLPEVFSHPVWISFGKEQLHGCPSMVDHLLRDARHLQKKDPSCACQVLLMCAAFQNYTGQRYHAFRTAQQALALAERTGLTREMVWSMWGICAISVQQGNYEQAVNNMANLQAILSSQNEWILADFVEVVKESLSQSVTNGTGKHSKLSRDPPSGDLLAFTFDWLHQWGLSEHTSPSEPGVISSYSAVPVTTDSSVSHSLFSIHHWQGRWHRLKQAFRGEPKLQPAQKDLSQKKSSFSFRKFPLSSLSLSAARRNINTRASEDESHIAHTADLPSSEQRFGTDLLLPNRQSASVHESKEVSHACRPTASSVPVAAQMLGDFGLTIGDVTMELPSSRGLSLLKYLLLHHKQRTPREVLMDTFWPDTSPEAARNNLNVAMHSLRHTLDSMTTQKVICFENGAYGFAPRLEIWLDVEQFEHFIKRAQQLEARDQLSAAVTEYENAVNLYQGDFLADGPYENWTVLEREHLRIAYLDTLAHLSQIYFNQEQYAGCVTLCQLILTRDLCREDAHYRLMQCYSRLGQRPLALRQYQTCVKALQAELEVDPAPETTRLYEQIHRHEQI